MFDTILVIAESQNEILTPQSLEIVSAAQSLPHKRIIVAIPAKSDSAAILALRELKLDAVWSLKDSILEHYNSDEYISAFSQVITQSKADIVLLAHSYQNRDFVPGLACIFNKSVLSDVIQIKSNHSEVIFIRNICQGRLHAEVALRGTAPHFISLQSGCCDAKHVLKGNAPCDLINPKFSLEKSLRVLSEAPAQTHNKSVDLSATDVIVAVGRGIKSEQHIPMLQKLANLMNAELAASRPICDEAWLPADRQIGSSGQTVSPKIYIAIGISGAIQHIIAMKSSATIVAINNDPNAPIFDIADIAIVADLFEIIPALITALESQASS